MEAVAVPQVVSLPSATYSAEETMLREDGVREILARLARGDGVKRIARELGIDRNTVKRWRRLGAWRAAEQTSASMAEKAHARSTCPTSWAHRRCPAGIWGRGRPSPGRSR
jgi:hypothetical protein